MVASNVSLVFVQVLKKDFEPLTPVAVTKAKQVKELNNVLNKLRANIKDMGQDPLKIQEERDALKRKANCLRIERDDLLAASEEKDHLLLQKDAELKQLRRRLRM